MTSDVTLADLHLELQAVMGWSNEHLYEFIIEGERYGEPHPDIEDVRDAGEIRLDVVISTEGTRFGYVYDSVTNGSTPLWSRRSCPLRQGRTTLCALQGDGRFPQKIVVASRLRRPPERPRQSKAQTAP